MGESSQERGKTWHLSLTSSSRPSLRRSLWHLPAFAVVLGSLGLMVAAVLLGVIAIGVIVSAKRRWDDAAASTPVYDGPPIDYDDFTIFETGQRNRARPGASDTARTRADDLPPCHQSRSIFLPSYCWGRHRGQPDAVRGRSGFVGCRRGCLPAALLTRNYSWPRSGRWRRQTGISACAPQRSKLKPKVVMVDPAEMPEGHGWLVLERISQPARGLRLPLDGAWADHGIGCCQVAARVTRHKESAHGLAAWALSALRLGVVKRGTVNTGGGSRSLTFSD